MLLLSSLAPWLELELGLNLGLVLGLRFPTHRLVRWMRLRLWLRSPAVKAALGFHAHR